MDNNRAETSCAAHGDAVCKHGEDGYTVGIKHTETRIHHE